MRDRVVAGFSERYGRQPELVVRSPGRVNLIGDHTDYNDGFVLPMAIEQATWLAAASRRDREVRIHSEGHGAGTIDLDHLEPSRTWLDYVIGTLVEIEVNVDRGFDAFIMSELPAGAGLSSSAALEVAVAFVVTELALESWDPV